MVGNGWLQMKNEECTRQTFSPCEMLEENEELNLGGNDADKVIAMSHRITGCNDCDEPSVIDLLRITIIEHILPTKLPRKMF